MTKRSLPIGLLTALARRREYPGNLPFLRFLQIKQRNYLGLQRFGVAALCFGGIEVKRSCQYCGRVHPVGYACPKRPKRRKQGAREAERFRNTYAWRKKREAIRARDHYLCVYSLAHGQIVYEDLEVHHIIPLEERPDLGLEDSNLITLSSAVHEKAESGEIDRAELLELVKHPPRGSEVKNGEGSDTTRPLHIHTSP